MNWQRLTQLFLLSTGLLVCSPLLEAATNPPPNSPRIGARTNAPIVAPGTAAKTKAAATNAAAAKQSAPAKGGPGLSERAGTNSTSSPIGNTLSRLTSPSVYYPAVAGVVLVLLIILAVRSRKAKKAGQAPASSLTVSSRPLPRKGAPASIHSCNVLQVSPQSQHLWQFEARSGSFNLNRDQSSAPGESLPTSLVAKSWRSLWQRKLNVAWLPAQHVFLRVTQLPQSDFAETLSMVELQLEKLSPMPVAQIAWSIHVLPHAKGKMQTVVVLIVARNVVEEFLGQLEGQGYLADRLELPLLDQLQATASTEDGAWIYPEPDGGRNAALVAWWYGGVLQNLDLLTLPATDRPASLKEQLLQMAWAGELEGWLTAPPQWHLVADAATAAEWEPALREGLEQPIPTAAPLATPELAARTARRAAHADPRANLLPAEFATRYQQQFVDRLWMRGLGAILGLYLIGVAIYAIALGVATWRTTSVEDHLASLGPTYTNAISLKTRYQVLKDRQELKFAALDCWNTTASLLPADVTLDSLNFSEGKRLALSGTAPADKVQQLIDFEGAMRKATLNGQALFNPTSGDNLSYRANVPPTTVSWNFSLELQRSEVQ